LRIGSCHFVPPPFASRSFLISASLSEAQLAFLVCFNAADAVIKSDDDEEIIVEILLCRRGTGRRFSIALLDLRVRFADSRKGSCGTQHYRGCVAPDFQLRSFFAMHYASERNHWDGGEVDSAVGDSSAEPVVFVSEEGVGLTAGTAVSVLRSHAGSKPTIARIQMYIFMRTL
jgi:hypothetical protein